MKFASSLLLAAASASLASAQVKYNSTTDTWSCPIANGSYCAKSSLTSSIIVLCVNGVGQTGDCSGHAQARPPIDVYEAPCYEVTPEAGNATCSKNCTIFSDTREPYPVPGSCNYSQPSTGSNIAGYGFVGASNSTNSTGPGSNTTIPSHTPTASVAPSSTSGSSPSSTGKSNAMALGAPSGMLVTGSSIFGLALAAAIAL